MITGKNYIGNTLSAKGTKIFTTFNPQTNTENTSVITEATSAEINQAAELAAEAFQTYSKKSGKEKASFLRAIADEIEALGDALLEIYTSESGLPAGRAMGERGRTVGQLRAFAAHVEEGTWVEATIDTAQSDRQPMAKVDLRKMNVALGPIVVFGASNFPLAFSTAGGDTAAALAAGCPVIVKSHPMHAGTGELVSSAIIKAAEKTGMPNGVFSNLNSSGIGVGQELVQHPNVKGVGFTGSIRGGRALFDLAAKRPEPIPVFAEMGSINPVVFLPEALNEKAVDWAKTYAGSITLGAGQFCTNPGLLLGIKGDGLNQFGQTLAEEIVKMEPTCMLHPNIFGAYESSKSKAISQEGVQVLADYKGASQNNYGHQIVSKVSGATFLENPTLHHEVFGPFSLLVACEDADQLEQILNKLEGQLTGTIVATDAEIESNSGIVSALQNRVGRIIFNGVPTGVEVCPSMQHGGPYPASTDARFTAVGVDSIKRWVRPFSFQAWPNSLLPAALKNENPLHILRTVDGVKTMNKI
ncbi:MAG: alpha-ketoglutaric semialdehyde dehydrogenase [Polaribacter sp.]|jgi:alpha-ketoglutaric semialdehyde dehydrogenase